MNSVRSSSLSFEEIDSILRQESPYAFVRHQNQIFWLSGLSREFLGATAATALMQSVFEAHRDLSFFILRQRIYTNEPFCEMTAGMLKVIGKRIEYDFRAQGRVELLSKLGLSDIVEVEFVDMQSSWQAVLQRKRTSVFFKDEPILSAESAYKLLARLQSEIPKQKALHDQPREVAALLVGPAGELISTAVNESVLNKTLHAEINLVQNFLWTEKIKIPPYYKIYVSHKPCKMCAAMIYESCENPSLNEVIYFQNVEGRHSVNTVLDRRHLNRQIIS